MFKLKFMKIFDYPIILASQSPRRSQLLSQAGFQFEVSPLDIEETYPDTLPKIDVAPYLAEKKAIAALEQFKHSPAIILTADSIVLLNDVIYGKPKDAEDARYILSQLSGQVHTVITGVCLAQAHKRKVFSGISKVHFESLTAEEIDFYVTNYKPFDKAGAYAIQEWIGLCKVKKIEGTYANIMGLPMELVYRELLEFVGSE
jgi:septum formation protein